MKIAAILFLVSLTTSSFAKDFRVLDFGNECRDVVELEGSRGALLDIADVGGELYIFSGSYDDGWPVTIAYRCGDGMLQRGEYIFVSTSYADGLERYRSLKQRFEASWGKPACEEASAEHRQRQGELGADSRAEACIWERNGTSVRLGLSGPHGAKGWNTILTFEPG